MRMAANILASLFIILMITGLIMQNDAGIKVAATGVVCGIIGYVIARFLRYKRMIDE